MWTKLKTSSTLWGAILVFVAANILVWHGKIDADAWWLAVSFVYGGYAAREVKRDKS